MNRLLLAAAVSATFASLAGPVSAQALQERNMPLAIALDIARADNAGPHTVEAARRKAFTSASTRTPTTAIVENVQKNPASAQLVAIDGFLVLGGGVPVKVGNETIGAVGIGGAPGGHLDEACANAAIAKVESQLK